MKNTQMNMFPKETTSTTDEIATMFNFKGNQFRIEWKKDEPLFCGKDTCDILEIANPSDAYSRLEQEDTRYIGLTEVTAVGQTRQRQMVFVNEFGLYDLILMSRKPAAKEFKRWITHEVLPSIRKHGAYVKPGADIEKAQALVDKEKRRQDTIEGYHIINETFYRICERNGIPKDLKTVVIDNWNNINLEVTGMKAKDIKRTRAEEKEDGEKLFIVKDFCDAVGIKNPSDAVRYANLDEDEVGIVSNDTNGKLREFLAVTESGMYGILMNSRKPAAKPFLRWIRKEVLPSILNKGYYVERKKAKPEDLRSEADLIDHERKTVNIPAYAPMDSVIYRLAKATGCLSSSSPALTSFNTCTPLI